MPPSPVSLNLPERALEGGLRLRRAGEADCAALTGLALAAKAVWGYSAAFLEATYEDMAVTPARLAEELVLLVEEGELPLALAAFGTWPETPAAAELTLAFVAPAAQGRGLGRILVEAVLAPLRAAGFRRLVVVSDPNAEGFYRRVGFRPEGLYRSPYVEGRTLPRLSRSL